ncbi:acid protease [Jaminaea rosea]|uniref:Acid protease n=1 Tax=Jaminaea rosea TaxID=1569628 RepID=A0A316US09_9BASI|nr:acid protease [Jaminaea rosea]PWN25915.1 acid protease [Jaminaea rosea]
MTALSLQFLHLLVLILSIGSLEPMGGGGGAPMGVAALPVSRRGSLADTSGFLEDRSSRAGTPAGDDSETNFPILHRRAGSISEGSSIPLKRMDPKANGAHPQMLLQHHINMANAKLTRMRQRERGSFSDQDRRDAMMRRRSAILGDMERRSVSLSERAPKRTGRVGFAAGHGKHAEVAAEKTGRRAVDAAVEEAHGGGDGEVDEEDGREDDDDDGEENGELSRREIPDEATPHNLAPSAIVPNLATDGSIYGANQHDASKFKLVSTSACSSKKSKSTGTAADSAVANKVNNAKASSSSSSSSSKSTQGYDVASNGFSSTALKASSSSNLIKASTPKTQGSLALDIEANDVGYIASVTIGTAGTFNLLVDSGSADTWVASTMCTNCSNSHKKLGKSTSSSFKGIRPQKNFSITYGTGDVAGHLGNDTLTIGKYKLPNHTFGLATDESEDFSDSSVPFDGLMGLAKVSLASTKTPTPIDSLYSTGQVKQPVMAYHLGRAADGKNNGAVTFGGVDATLFSGSLTELPNVSNQGFWEVNLDSVGFGGKSISLDGSQQRTAILDTGTTLIVAPQADADALHSAIPGAKSDGQGGYTIPCTTAKQVSFTFGGKQWPIDARDMTFLPVDDNNPKGDCISSISAGSVGAKGEWLVGAAFLKNVYFATNSKSNTIALGKLS